MTYRKSRRPRVVEVSRYIGISYIGISYIGIFN
jgi:hypothetical protein